MSDRRQRRVKPSLWSDRASRADVPLALDRLQTKDSDGQYEQAHKVGTSMKRLMAGWARQKAWGFHD